MDNLNIPPSLDRAVSCESTASDYVDAVSSMDDLDDTDDNFENYIIRRWEVKTSAVSCESTSSDYVDAVSSMDELDDTDDNIDNDEEIDCYDLTMELDDMQVLHTVNPLLYSDMEMLIFLYGENSLQYRVFESIDEIDVELNIPLGFLSEETAEAWKVNREEPLIVRLHLSFSTYLESSTQPKIEVLQPSKKENFGFGSQVRKFLENFLAGHWPNVSKEYQRHLEEAKNPTKSQSCPQGFSGESSNNDVTRVVSDEAIAKLMELGFDSTLARNALIITHGNIHEASQLIASNPDTCLEVEIPEMLEQPTKKFPKPSRQLSHPPILGKLKRMLPKLARTTSIASSVTDSNIHLSYAQEDLNLIPQSTYDGKKAKITPSIHNGFLVQVFQYVRQRIPTVNEYCVICDEPHVFQNGSMLKPAVCNRELCVFAFQTLGVMADAAEDIATGAEVVDLLIKMTQTAAKSNRTRTIFDPFPTVVDPQNPCNLLFNPKSPDYDLVSTLLQRIPDMSEMTKMMTSLRAKLAEIHPAIYPLMQWIITSNRSHIVKLPAEKQLFFMHTPHQFLMLSSPPAKEMAFREAKQKYGSTFAFHGSSIENWHSIIRKGLVNASGTKLQVNGAAYGKGIYLSPHISTSMGYSRMGYGSQALSKNKALVPNNARYLDSNDIKCIALCEVITTPNLKKSGSIWVCPDEKHVCTRFFFVYESGRVGDSSIDTQKKETLDIIRSACGFKF